MATKEQEAFTEALRMNLDSVLAVDIDRDLIREKRFGTLGFLEHKGFLHEVAAYCRSIRDLQWVELTPNQIQRMRDLTHNLQLALHSIEQFNPTTQRNPGSYRTERIQLYEREYFSLKEYATPLVAFLTLRELDLEDARRVLAEEAEKARAEVAKLIDDLEKLGRAKREEGERYRAQTTSHIQELNQLRDESKRTLEAQRTAAAVTGVGRYAEIFREAAERHEKLAIRWLIATPIMGVLTATAVAAAVLGWDVSGDISDAGVLQVVLAKTAVLAIGLYFTFSAGRLYRANAHLAVVNRHRQDSLSTFEAFVAGAGDDRETKSKLLLEAAHAAFGQVPTGLAPTKEGGNTVEVLDGAASVFRRT